MSELLSGICIGLIVALAIVAFTEDPDLRPDDCVPIYYSGLECCK